MSFRKDFLWGAASAATQIEGAYLDDGRSPSIWDDPDIIARHIDHGETPHVACDHYHRWREDVALMKRIGLNSYRFSVSWSRVMPEPGVVNMMGVQFYKNLVRALREAEIEPVVTLFHWDLPLWAHEAGGWENGQIVDWFADYVHTVVAALSDRVRWWITFNEPQMFVGRGYVTGQYAPFRVSEDPELLGKITRNVMLSHGRAVDIIRAEAKIPPMIGMAPTGPVYTPATEADADIRAAYDRTFAVMPGAESAAW